jgi:hypothetical protein
MTSTPQSPITEFWCRTMHSSPMWPSHGHYQCRTCGREYPVPWEQSPSQPKNQRPLMVGSAVRGNAIIH